MINLISQGTSPIFQEQNGLPLVIGLVEIGEKSQSFSLLERIDAALCGIGIPALGGKIPPNHWLGGGSLAANGTAQRRPS